ncbi:chemotaxis protein CheW [Actinoplanes palleronii]|uniref:CheW-like domain-containing protein n=1 Tax=Actinoplanes palleronii TaxID=113570 RepID=A0ABQ4B4X9_9ACTN|nr:chemotaxis protein CheW [Actinoplanes palleronii]GIE65700.1 hypothetical protein Apa02nite_018080 [Actinoplanes palleronii]
MSDYVTFELAGERCAFPTDRVKEIIRMPEVVRVPLGPPALVGLADLHGRALPVVSLRVCCAMEQPEQDATSRVIVMDGDVPLGFVVDRVSGVISVDPSAVDPAEEVRAAVHPDVLAGVIRSGGGAMTAVLDVDRLIDGRYRPAATARSEA